MLTLALFTGVVLWLLAPTPFHWFTSAGAGLTLLWGAARLTRGFGWSPSRTVLLVVLLIVPLVNVPTLLWLNRRATRELRSLGFRVRLFGAAPRDLPPPLGVPWEPDSELTGARMAPVERA